MSEAYLVLITWPDGTEGLLFPRPGNVPLNTTQEDGLKDYATAVDHLNEFIRERSEFANTKVRLVRFTRHEVVKEYPEPPVEKIPPTVIVADLQAVEGSLLKSMYTCKRCGREMSHTRQWGYICEYCNGIED